MRLTAAIVLVACILLPGAACAQTLLNGHFASPYNVIDSNTSVADKWAPFRVSMNPQFKQSDFEQMPGGPGGQISCQQIWSDGVSFWAGVYQQMTGAVVGRTYRLTGWMLSIWGHGVVAVPPYQDGNIYQKLGIDPTGGTNPSSASVIWSWDDPLDRRWRELVVDAAAQSTTITVFAYTRSLTGQRNCVSFYDAFTLAQSDPVRISNVTIRPGVIDATFTWTTDVPADSRVLYIQYQGPSKDYSGRSDAALTTQHSITVTGLLPSTRYYFKIISGAVGKHSSTYCPNSPTNPFQTLTGEYFADLARAKNNPDGTRVYVKDVTVTVPPSQQAASFFVQQQDPPSGIRVDKGSLSLALGAKIDITGELATVEGERRLTLAAVVSLPANSPLEPVGVATRVVGGGRLDDYDPGITGGSGANNIGLLVTVWGRITVVDAANKCFYIDDGAGLFDGALAGRRGLRILWSNITGSLSPLPAKGNYAIVTGFSSCFQANGNTLPQVLLRNTRSLRQF